MSMDMSQFPGMSQVDLSRSFTPEGFSRMRDQSNQLYLQLTGSSSDTTNAFMAGFSHALKLMTGFSSASIGRFSGVLAHTNAIGTGQPIALVIAGSGARIYNVEGLGVDDATIKAVARTFTTH